jgi:hypothetical protein
VIDLCRLASAAYNPAPRETAGRDSLAGAACRSTDKEVQAMRRILGLISAVVLSWSAGAFEARAADPDQVTGWRSGTVQVAPLPSSRRNWFVSNPDAVLGGERPRPVTLMQPYVGRLSYNCEDQANDAPARLPVPPPDIIPISATETIDGVRSSAPLAADDPARVILEIRDKVGPNLFAGTIFQDSNDKQDSNEAFTKSIKTEPTDQRAVLVRCIRDLEQNREPLSAASGDCDGQCECCTGRLSAASSPEAVQALRLASRQLQEIAEVLEEQHLYDRADQLRDAATELRQQARDAVQTVSDSGRGN